MLLAKRSRFFRHLSSPSHVRFSAIGSPELRVCYVDLGQCRQVIRGRTSTRCRRNRRNIAGRVIREDTKALAMSL